MRQLMYCSRMLNYHGRHEVVICVVGGCNDDGLLSIIIEVN